MKLYDKEVSYIRFHLEYTENLYNSRNYYLPLPEKAESNQVCHYIIVD